MRGDEERGRREGKTDLVLSEEVDDLADGIAEVGEDNGTGVRVRRVEEVLSQDAEELGHLGVREGDGGGGGGAVELLHELLELRGTHELLVEDRDLIGITQREKRGKSARTCFTCSRLAYSSM